MSNTIFRVGTANMYDNSIRNVSARQASLVNLQENLTSGKRVVRASDDPVSAAQAERAMTRMTRIQTEQRALETQRNAIAQATKQVSIQARAAMDASRPGEPATIQPGLFRKYIDEAFGTTTIETVRGIGYRVTPARPR